MKLSKKQSIAIAAILAAGLALALLIVFAGRSGAGGHEDGHGDSHDDGHGHAAAAAPAKAVSPKTEQHDDVIAFSDAQLRASGIALGTAGAAAIGGATTLSGELRFNGDRTAHIVPRLAGVVDSVQVDLGQQVKKGQVMAVIASTELSELRSALLSAQKRLAFARTLLEREKKLWEDQISPEQDYLQARQTANEAEIAANNARQKLSALGAGALPSGTGTGVALNRYEIRAPFDGMVLEKHISAGEAVKEDANIFIVSDLSTVWAEVAVPPAQLPAVRVGQRATVKATAFEASTEGTVLYVGALVGEQTRAATARLSLRNPDLAWRPGLFVTVDVAAPASPAPLAVQRDAVQTVDGKSVVYVRVPGGFAARAVALGRSDAHYAEVLDGLAAGAQYAAKGSFIVKAQQGKDGNEHAH